jgi:hypothetical protein
MSALPKTDAPATLGSQAAWSAYAAIRGARGQDQLDQACRAMWQACSSGAISEADATFLQSCVNDRRTAAAGKRFHGGTIFPAGRVQPRQQPRSPARSPRPRLSHMLPEQRLRREERRRRKRELGGSSAMPAGMRDFTDGERATLCVVAGEVKRCGLCTLTLKEIGDRAGVSASTARNALHEARKRGYLTITERPRPGRKNLPNVVRIVSREWLVWIKRGPSAAHASGFNFKNVNASKSIEVKPFTVAAAAASQGALRSRMGTRSSPSLRR